MKNIYPKSPATATSKRVTRAIALFAVILALAAVQSGKLFAQSPTLTYNPQTFTVGTAVSVSPNTSTGVASPAYNNIVLASGINAPTGVAVDGVGNVYVTGTGFSGVQKIPVGGGSPVSIYSATSCRGIAVDASGNVFVATYDVNTLVKIPAGGGAAQTLTTGLQRAMGVALDAAGNIYVTTLIDKSVHKIGPGGGAGTVIASGFSDLEGLAVAPNGDVYVADGLDHAIYKVAAAGGAPVKVADVTGAYGVAFDGTGNLYVSDATNNRIVEIPADGSAQVVTTPVYTSPMLLASDAFGNVYVPYYSSNVILEIAHSGGYYTSGLPPGLILNNTTGVISGTPTASSIPTNYFVHAYNATGSTSAPITIGVSGTGLLSNLSLSIGIVFPAFSPGTNSYITVIPAGANTLQVIPKTNDTNAVIKVNGTVVKSGVRSAGIPVVNGANSISITVTPAYGSTNTYTISASLSNDGSLSVAYPNAPAYYTVGTAITPLSPISVAVAAQGDTTLPYSYVANRPYGAAADAQGSLYIADTHNLKVIATSDFVGSTAKPLTLDSGYACTGIAVDASRNVYVSNYDANTLVKIPYGGGPKVTLCTGLTNPLGVAVDAAGNIYVAASGKNSVYKVAPGGGPATLVASGFGRPAGVAVDAAGNVYIADNAAGVVYKESVNGGAPVPIFNLANCYGLAIDGAGNIYISATDPSNNPYDNNQLIGGVIRIPADGSGNRGYNTVIYPGLIAVDPFGNLFVPATTGTGVQPIMHVGGYYATGLPAGLSINNATGVISGTPTASSAAKTYVIEVYNLSGPSIFFNIASYRGYVDMPQVIGTGQLSALTTSSGTLSPAFATGTNSYSVAVSGATTAIQLTPTTNDATAVIKVNGTVVVTGTPSANIPLPVGTTTINVVVTPVNGTANTYTVTVTRPATPLPTLSYTSPQTYTVGAAISALSPTSSNVFAPSDATTVIGSGYNQPFGVAADAAGNVYIADTNNGQVLKLPVGGGASSVIYSGTVTAIAIGSTGNIYLADYGAGSIVEIPASGPQVTLASGLNQPYCIAVDPAGNVYAGAKDSFGLVYRIPVGGTASVLTGAVQWPTGLAADAFGNLFIASAYSANVYKMPAAGGTPVAINPTNNSNDPTQLANIAVDPSGNLYVASPFHASNTFTYGTTGIVRKFPADGSAVVTIGTGLQEPWGLAFANGNLYITDLQAAQVSKVSHVGGYYANNGLPPGLTVNSSTGVISGTPTIGSLAANYTITGYNTTGATNATVNIKVNGSANLSGLTISTGTLSPAFAAATTSYTDAVNVASVTLTPTVADISAVIKVNGTVVPSGKASASIPLSIGSNAITILVTTVDGTTKTYTVTVNKTASPDATLSNLVFSSGALSPGFVPAATSYTNLTGAATTTVTPTTNDPHATVKVNGTTVTSGSASPAIALSLGSNTVTIVVTAQDGTTTDTYTTTVTRVPLPVISYTSPNSYFTGITIAPLTPTSSNVGTTPFSTPVVLASGLGYAGYITLDAAGNLYVADRFNGVIKEFPASGGGLIILSSSQYPVGVAVDAAGNVYVSDFTITTLTKIPVGGGSPVAVGSGFYDPAGLKLDAAGNIYVADSGNGAIKEILASGGNTITLASGLNRPSGIDVDAAGNIYTTDANNKVYKIPPGGGSITTIATGFNNPNGIAVDAAGNIFVADTNNGVVKEVPAGGGPVVTLFSSNLPFGLLVDANENIYVSSNALSANVIKTHIAGGYYISPSLPAGLSINNTTGIISGTPTSVSTAANYTVTGYNTAGLAGTATVNIGVTLGLPPAISYAGPQTYPINVAITPLLPTNTGGLVAGSGFTLVSTPSLPAGLSFDNSTGAISGTPTTLSSATYTIIVSNTFGSDTARVNITVNDPSQPPIISYASPQLYPINTAITPLVPANTGGLVSSTVLGQVTTIAGSGGGIFNNPTGVATDAQGDIYVADQNNNLIKKITPAGAVSIFAGSSGEFNHPFGVALDAAGNVYVGDSGNNVIKKITPAGVVTVFAGSGSAGSANGSGTAASFNSPKAVATDAQGNLYVGDYNNYTVRKITPGGVVSTFAGTGLPGSANGTGTSASFSSTAGVATDSQGNVYVADDINNLIRKITPSGVVTTLAGTGAASYQDGQGNVASFHNPNGLAADAQGNIYVTDTNNDKIRRITPAGVVSTFAGGSPGGDGLGSQASFYAPVGIIVNAQGNIYVGDTRNNLVRKIVPVGPYSISAALPTGLSFDVGTGVIAGTPTVAGQGGIYTISATGATGTGTATVSIFTGTLSFPPIAPVSYGSADFNPGEVSQSPIVYTSSNTSVATIVSGNIHITGGGNTTITATSAGVSLTQILTVNPVALTITANPQNIFQGDAIPTLTATYTGLVNGDTPASLTTQPTFNTTATSGSPAGSYPITVSGASSPSYTITYVPNTLTINAPTPLIIAANPQSMVQGAAIPTLTVTYTGLVNGDTPASLTTAPTITTTATRSSAPGSYPITVSGASSSHYTITYIPDNLTVIFPAPNISYGSPQTYYTNLAVPAIKPTNTGGAVPVTTYDYVSVFAGSGAQGSTNGTGNAATFRYPIGIATDVQGNVYVCDAANNLIRQITPDGVVTTYAGSGAAGSANGAAASASFNNPTGIAVDAQGNVYVGDEGNYMIRKITPGGVVSTLAGSGTAGATDGTGTAASFNHPRGLAIDAQGDIYVADYYNNLIRKITSAGVVTTFAGTGTAGSANGVGTAASFNQPIGVATDIKGNVYVADGQNHLVRKITPAGVVSTFAGSGSNGAADGTGATATFGLPASVTTDVTGNVYVADMTNNAIRKITPLGVVTTLAGGTSGFAVGIGTQAKFNLPQGIAADNQGNLYISDYLNQVIRQLFNTGYSITPALPAGLTFNVSNGVISGAPTSASTTTNYAITAYNTGGSSTAALNIVVNSVAPPAISYAGPQSYPTNIAITPLAPSSTGGGFDPSMFPLVSTLAGIGGCGHIDGTGTAAAFCNPPGVATDVQGNVYVADQTYNLIRKITTAGVVTTIAGTPSAGFVNGTGTAASFNQPIGVAADLQGNVYVADTYNHAIRKIDPAGVVTTLAGNGTSGSVNGTGTGASFSYPYGAAVDLQGNVYVADLGNRLVRKITPAGVVTTLAGGGPGLANDGTGTAASFAAVNNVATDLQGNVYVADGSVNKIRKITPAGVVTTFAGSGASGSANGTGTAATFNFPRGVAVDSQGNVYVSETGNNDVRKITPAGVVSTVAGNGTAGAANAIGTAATFSGPTEVAVDGGGNLYIADYGNNKIRKIVQTGYSIIPALPTGLSLDGTTGTISGTPTVASAATNYVVTANNVAGSANATININVYAAPVITYTTPQTYAKGTAITPLTPVNTSSPVAAQGYSSTTKTIGSGFSSLYGIAVDLARNVYVSDFATKLIYELPAGGGAITWTGSVANPGLLAADNKGNIFAIDNSNGTIKKIVNSTGTTTTIATALNPVALAVDTAGNIYTINSSTKIVNRIPAAGGSPVAVGSAFTAPRALAVNAAGDIYVLDAGTSSVKKIPAAGGSTVTIASGFANPTAMAIDGAGNIFVADYNNVLKEVPAGSSTAVTITTAVNAPQQLAVDIYGNVYGNDGGGTLVKEIKRTGGYNVYPSLPTGLSINTTTGIISGTPAQGTKATNYLVSAINAAGTGSTTLNINTISVATLSGLAVTGLISGTDHLNPVFASGTTTYTDTVNNANLIAKIIPTATDPAAIIKVNGTVVASGATSGNIGLTVGLNTITTVVTSDGGIATSTYTIKLIRLSNNAYLSNLGASATISPVFNTNVIAYTASVANTIPSFTVVPTTTDATAKVKVNGTTVASGSASPAIPLVAGPNSIQVVVTAQDGTIKTYTITVTRARSTDATLAGLSLSSGALTPVFGTNTTTYTQTVSNTITSLTVTPVTNNTGATVTVNGSAVISGATSASIPLNLGANTITTVVTAQDNSTTKTYTVTVTRLPSSDAGLSALIVSSGSLSPAFATGTLSYADTVSNTTASITVTPTINNPNATVTVNGSTVASGTASGSIPLSIGANVITTVVTAQDGSTTNTYTITVLRTPSNDASLSALTISNGTLAPVFATGTTSYTSTVTNATTSITITPTVNFSGATVTVNGTLVASGTPSTSLTLTAGSNVITTVVTAQDGSTTRSYVVTVTRLPNITNDASLTSLAISNGTLSPAFASATTAYTDTVSNATTSTTVTPTIANAGATIKVNGVTVNSGTASGAIALNTGNNTITTVVTAADGVTKKTYTIIVNRISNNPYLTSLTLSSGILSPVFAAGTGSYTASVGNEIASITATPTLNNPNATVKVNGVLVSTGTASATIPLVVGANTITASVTAQDGVTKKTYTVVVTRATGDATLSNLTISSGTLSPVFDPGTVGYTASVSNATASIKLTPTVNNPNATVQVNGVAVSSGAASAAIPLVVGANTITTVVTALDGVTTKTYTVTVTRLLSDVDLTSVGLSSGTLSPVFSSAITSYTATVTNATASITVTPTLNNPASTVKVNNVVAASGTASAPIALAVGNTTINIVVTAPDGVTRKTFAIVVTRPSNNAYLTNLTISTGTLSPAFVTATGAYTTTVSNATASVTVTPTLNNPHATITVNGTAISSGAVSQAIALAVGNTTINTVVTAQDGVTKKNYTITVTRVSNNAYLSNLAISSGTLSPAFAQATSAYTDSVSNATASVTVTPTLNNPHGSLTVNGTTITSGTASAAIPLNVGANTITTAVTAQDGVTHKTYTITIIRASGGVNSLYLPGDNEQTPLVSSLNEKVEANNILSPNGDGINDIWVVKNIVFYPDNTVTVYNSAGEVVFTKKGYANDWDGTYRGSVLSEGTYYYLVDLGNGKNVKGFITVVSH